MNHVTVRDMDKEAPTAEALYRYRFMYDGLSVDQAANLSPEGAEFQPVEIRALSYLHALIAELKNQQSTVIPFKSSNKHLSLAYLEEPSRARVLYALRAQNRYPIRKS